MRSLWHSPLFRSGFLMVTSLIMLAASICLYIRDSQGKQNMLTIGGTIMIVVCLFWLVGGVPSGRSMLKDERSLTKTLFVAAFALTTVILQVLIYFAPTNSLIRTLLYFGRDLMITGAAFWLSILYIYRELIPSE